MSEPEVTIEEGRLGTQMSLYTAWSDELREMYVRHGVKDLYIMNGACVPQSGLGFLVDLPGLVGLTLHVHGADLGPLQRLTGLRRLHLHAYNKSPLDLKYLPNLTEFGDWHSPFINLDAANRLETLELEPAPKKLMPTIGHLERLTALRLFSSTAEDLSPLGNLSALKKLRITLFRRNGDNTFVAKLENLEDYFIQDSKGFNSFEPLRDLRNLKKIVVSESGPIDSLEPLRELSQLEHFGTTGPVLDGDYSPVEDMPQLQYYVVSRR